MKKWFVFLAALILLTACAAAELSAPDVEPALTAVLESKPSTSTPTPISPETETAEPAPTATVEPAETAVIEQLAVSEEEKVGSVNPAAMPVGAVIIFHQSGGFAGLDQQWIIYLDGSIDLPDGTQKQVEVSQVQTLLEDIQAANFFDLNESYVPLDACCDRFVYSLVVRQGDRIHQVTTLSDTPQMPVELQEILELVSGFLASQS